MEIVKMSKIPIYKCYDLILSNLSTISQEQ